MARKEDREIRAFNAYELNAGDAGTENEGNGGGVVEGYASTFDTYDLLSFDIGEGRREIWREEIARGAFDKTDMSDVVFLRDHQGQVYARTKNNLIAIMADERGLFTRTNLTKTPAAREMYEDIVIGNYNQMSFAFTVGRDSWDTFEENGNVVYKRTITAISKIYDISAVSFPANPYTDIAPATRAAFNGEIERIRAERLEAEQRAREDARKRAAIKIKIMEAKNT